MVGEVCDEKSTRNSKISSLSNDVADDYQMIKDTIIQIQTIESTLADRRKLRKLYKHLKNTEMKQSQRTTNSLTYGKKNLLNMTDTDLFGKEADKFKR